MGHHGVTAAADGSGWSVVTDLGYQVEITRGYLTGSTTAVPFSYTTSIAHGQGEDVRFDGPGHTAHVNVRRRLSTLLSGILLESESEVRTLRSVLANLVRDTTFSTALEP